MAQGAQHPGKDRTEVRPFRVNVREAELTDLCNRINAVKWPERETVPDGSQGVPLAMMQELAALLGRGLRLAQVRVRS
jgi:hypothetical protein